MANVRIVRIPTGVSPEEIRAAWVGCEVPLRGLQDRDRNTYQLGATNLPSPEKLGYVVDSTDMYERLKTKDPRAAQHLAPLVASKSQIILPVSLCEIAL